MVVQLEHLAAGTLGGFTSCLLLHPLDLLKIRFAVNEGRVADRPQHGSYWQTGKAIVHAKGFLGLYQGVTPNLCGAAISWGLYFLLYNTFKNALTEKFNVKQLTAVHSLSAGFVSGSLTLAVTNPIWVAKTRLCLQYEHQQLKYRNLLHCLSSILKSEGLRGWYKGFLPGLIGTSHGALQFMAYDELKRRFGSKQQQTMSLSNTSEHLTFAALSKMFAASSTYPYQVVRARLQDQHRKYDGVTDVVLKTWRGEGLKGFYKGMGASLLRVTPATCITFVVYENTMTLLRNGMTERRPGSVAKS